jgi:hypothetical protein
MNVVEAVAEIGSECYAEVARLRAELQEAIAALPQAVRAERERCAEFCERRADSLPFGGAAAARQCARDIRNGEPA